jgi:hypothetical protein
MDPLHSSKVSIPGRILGLVLKTGWYKSKFKKTVMGLFLLLHLGNCITTINVPQASSLITIKFDACLFIPCADLKNQHYTQGLEIYMCMWPFSPCPFYRDNRTSQYDNLPCATWSAVGVDNRPKRECCTSGFMILWLYESALLETYTAKNANL